MILLTGNAEGAISFPVYRQFILDSNKDLVDKLTLHTF